MVIVILVFIFYLQWCQNFHLQRGVQVKRLRVALPDSRPDVVFIVGIEVRPGRGKYRATNIVTISPRFQLHNKSSYKLLFAQKCFTTNLVSIITLKCMNIMLTKFTQADLFCINYVIFAFEHYVMITYKK